MRPESHPLETEASTSSLAPSEKPHQILYCHCAYAKVISKDVKEGVLKQLLESSLEFDAVPDLCEMSARKDPSLARFTQEGSSLKVAACFPRAVKWLFEAAGTPLHEAQTEVLNMRTLSPEEIATRCEASDIQPNVDAPPSQPPSA